MASKKSKAAPDGAVAEGGVAEEAAQTVDPFNEADPVRGDSGAPVAVEQANALSDLAQQLHDDATKDADPLAGLDTKPKQPFLDAPGMKPNIPTEVLDAATAVINARREVDAAMSSFKRAAGVLMERMDKNSLRFVKVTDDIALRLEAPETRLKMDGYKKPATSKPPKEKKAGKAKAPTKEEREAIQKEKADAAAAKREAKAKEKADKPPKAAKGGKVADIASRRKKGGSAKESA